MPYYYWRGVDLSATIKKGRLFARSEEHLDQLLLKRHIALLSSKPIKQLIAQPIRLAHVAHFFNRFAVLINAGVLVPDALSIVGDQLSNTQLQELVHALAQQVNEGISLSAAMKHYPKLFNNLMIQLINAGEESGRLPQALHGICEYIHSSQQFKRQVRAALMAPLITIIFFMVISILIFTVIMPRFVDIFASMNQAVPPLTKKLLAISAFTTSLSMVIFLLVLILLISIFYRITRQGAGRKIMDATLLRVPIVGTIIQERFLSHALQSLALLVEGGMPVVQALQLVRGATTHHIFSQHLLYLEYDVASGSSLSDAMARHPDAIFSQDSIAMMQVAEASGTLAPLLNQIVVMYQQETMRRLSMLTFLLQPLIMIILGLLVGLLIFAVYTPIFSLSSGF